MHPEDPSFPDGWAPGGRQPAGDPLLDRLRSGQAEAGEEFVREYYAGVYRYLLYLSGRPEWAEDLTQQTFLQAWRHLGRFVPDAPLRAWLHRIAHREFLQSLRSQRPVTSLDDVDDLPAPLTAAWTDAVELRALLGELPLQQREVVVLHDLEGYTAAEIAAIVRVPVTTVNYRLLQARNRLRRELGEGDLSYLNEPAIPMRQWAWLPLDQMHALETRLTLDARSEVTKEDTMERREFLRHAAVGAAGLVLPEAEKEVVDTRLTQKVTCAFKATALSDLCEKLKSDTGIPVTAGPSVADEKVTLFCEKTALREVMRQLSRPFGYTWLRSGTQGAYKYELVQDLRSQLLEEELRNRDRNAALLALEKETERFRPYLSLSPDEALARSRSAPAEEKALLERFAGRAWGAIEMYSRLSPQQMAALRAGQELQFRTSPGPNEEPLPTDVARGVLESQRDWRIRGASGEYRGVALDNMGPDTFALTALPELRGKVKVGLLQTEIGQVALYGEIGWQAIGPEGKSVSEASTSNTFLSGSNATVQEPDNATAMARFARDPALRPPVTVRPQPSYHPTPDPDAPEQPVREAKVTNPDVLEALHRASGLPLVADYYTRLYPVAAVSTGNRPLSEAVNQLAAAMRLRWGLADGNWLQFRSAGYYNDRLKEVPNRLLTRWAAARERQAGGGAKRGAGPRDGVGGLALDDLAEIAQLPDSQLDGDEMAEGARECFGLREWDLIHGSFVKRNLRESWRFVASLTPDQREEAMSPGGLPFVRMSLAQQQRFLAIALSTESAGANADALAAPLHSLDELAGAALRVDYTQSGWFQWLPPGSIGRRGYPMVVPLEPGPRGRRALMPCALGRTRAAALEAARRIDPKLREGLTRIDPAHLDDSSLPVEPAIPQETEIVRTRRDIWFVYFLGSTRPSLTRNPDLNCYQGARGRQ